MDSKRQSCFGWFRAQLLADVAFECMGLAAGCFIPRFYTGSLMQCIVQSQACAYRHIYLPDCLLSSAWPCNPTRTQIAQAPAYVMLCLPHDCDLPTKQSIEATVRHVATCLQLLLSLLAHLLASQTLVPLGGLLRSCRSCPCCRAAEPMLSGQPP